MLTFLKIKLVYYLGTGPSRAALKWCGSLTMIQNIFVVKIDTPYYTEFLKNKYSFILNVILQVSKLTLAD
jgi:hypothetical protein